MSGRAYYNGTEPEPHVPDDDPPPKKDTGDGKSFMDRVMEMFTPKDDPDPPIDRETERRGSRWPEDRS